MSCIVAEISAYVGLASFVQIPRVQINVYPSFDRLSFKIRHPWWEYHQTNCLETWQSYSRTTKETVSMCWEVLKWITWLASLCKIGRVFLYSSVCAELTWVSPDWICLLIIFNTERENWCVNSSSMSFEHISCFLLRVIKTENSQHILVKAQLLYYQIFKCPYKSSVCQT